MGDVRLRASLATVEGDAPSAAFLGALFAELEAEREQADAVVVLPYLPEPSEEVILPAGPTGAARRGPVRRWIGAGIAVAAAAAVILAGLVVVDSGDDGSRVATRLPHGYAPSVLPNAIVDDGDAGVTFVGDPSTGLDPVVAPWYPQERSSIDDLAFVAGLSVPFDLAVPGEGQLCSNSRRNLATPVGTRSVPCGGSSAALLFADDVGAVEALDVLVGHLEGHSAGLYQLGVVLERERDVAVRLGDEGEGYVLGQFIDAREAAQVVVIAWRTDNLVQFVWDIQHRGSARGVQALLDVAASIERRTAAERQPGAEED